MAYTIALQKSGRLSESDEDLLAALNVKRRDDRKYFSVSPVNPDVRILWCRDDDIPQLVARRKCDFGIVGQNVLWEMTTPQTEPLTIRKTGTGRCRLSFAVAGDAPWRGLEDLNGKVIATSYTNFAPRFLAQNKINADIFKMTGSVESAIALGAYAILDLVESGKSLRENGLKEVYPVFESQVVAICNLTVPISMRNQFNQWVEPLDWIMRGLPALMESRKQTRTGNTGKWFDAFNKGNFRSFEKLSEEAFEMCVEALSGGPKRTDEAADFLFRFIFLTTAMQKPFTPLVKRAVQQFPNTPQSAALVDQLLAIEKADMTALSVVRPNSFEKAAQNNESLSKRLAQNLCSSALKVNVGLQNQPDRFEDKMADLLVDFMLALKAQDLSWRDINQCLISRNAAPALPKLVAGAGFEPAAFRL